MTLTFSLVESESPRCFHLPDSATSNLGSTWSCHSNEWYFLFPPLCVVVFNAQSAKAVQRAPPCAFTATECYTLLSSSQGRVVTSYDPLRWLPVSSSCSTQSQNRKQWHFTALISVPAPPSLCPSHHWSLHLSPPALALSCSPNLSPLLSPYMSLWWDYRYTLWAVPKDSMQLLFLSWFHTTGVDSRKGFTTEN